MVDRPQAPPPAPAARRRWGGPRRALAYLAGAGALATALAVQACSDAGPTGARAGAPRATGQAAGGAAPITMTAESMAWIGREHNRALEALVPGAWAERRASSWTRQEACAYAARSAEAYIRAGRAAGGDGRPLAWAEVPANTVRDGMRLAEVCASRSAGGLASFVEVAARAAREGRAGGAGGGELSPQTIGDPALSPEANALLASMEWAIDYSGGASALSSSLQPIEQQASLLPGELDRATVLSAASTARASAYNVEYNLPPGETPPPADMSAGGGVRPMGRIGVVVKADVKGCIAGGISGFFRGGGAPGVAIGCFAGGVGSSLAEMALE